MRELGDFLDDRMQFLLDFLFVFGKATHGRLERNVLGLEFLEDGAQLDEFFRCFAHVVRVLELLGGLGDWSWSRGSSRSRGWRWGRSLVAVRRFVGFAGHARRPSKGKGRCFVGGHGRQSAATAKAAATKTTTPI